MSPADHSGSSVEHAVDRVLEAIEVADRCDGHVPEPLVSDLHAVARAVGPGPARDGHAGRVAETIGRVEERARSRRRDDLLRIGESMGRLQELRSRRAIIEAAAAEVCVSCGFSRSLLSRVRGATWVPEILSTRGPDRGPDDFEAYLRFAEIPLEHVLGETEMARRGQPILVHDALHSNRTFLEIIRASGAHSYTAAPITSGRRAIGFLHCDRLGQDQPLTDQDRENLRRFTQQLAQVLEVADLHERVDELHELTKQTIDDALVDLRAARPDSVVVPLRTSSPPDAADRPDVAPERLLLALTDREHEVLDLLAVGATNVDIAHRLVITEGTVKTHVKHLLRKLRVRNRAEATALYLHARP
jgi:LuxR family transcriptional regulator, regulator of acetate metabolism